MGGAMLDRKVAIYTIQVCGWKGHIGETSQRRDQRPQRKKTDDRKHPTWGVPCWIGKWPSTAFKSVVESNQKRDQRPQSKKQMTGSIQHGEYHVG